MTENRVERVEKKSRKELLFFFNDTATTEIYTYRHTLSLHDALPICLLRERVAAVDGVGLAGNPLGSVRAQEQRHVRDVIGLAEAAHDVATRSAARRVGKECVSTCRSRWSPYH